MAVPRLMFRAVLAAAAVSTVSLYFLWHPVGVRRSVQVSPSYKPSRTNERFLARDWTPSLGWNNCRYIIEAAINLAVLLDRTLILPPFVYGRDCIAEPSICSMFTPRGLEHDARLAEFGEAFPTGTHWKDRYVMPLEMFVDIDLLLQNAPVITYQDFVRRFNLGPSMGNRTGSWPESFKDTVQHYTADFSVYAPKSAKPAILVDKLPANAGYSKSSSACRSPVKGSPERGKVLRQPNITAWTPRDQACLRRNGQTALFSFSDLLGAMKTPSVADPMQFVALTSDLVGVQDELKDRTELVLHIKGQKLHERSPPGMTWFTSDEARLRFARVIAQAVRPPKVYLDVGTRAAARMRQKVGGRGYLSGHVRRGDMLGLHWIDMTLPDHYAALRVAFDGGLGVISTHQDLLKTAGLDPVRQRPLASDPIFIATNANLTEELLFLRTHGAILLPDLLTPYDRQLLGLGGLFGDIESIVAQVVMAQSAYCVMDTLSSVGSWVLGMRNAAGVDRRLLGLVWSGVKEGTAA